MINQFFNDRHYHLFQALVARHSGLHFPEKKRLDLETGVRQAIQDSPAHLQTFDAYYHYLTTAPLAEQTQALGHLTNILTVGETHFFRDKAQMSAITQTLAQLIEKKRQLARDDNHAPELRLWSAGCATGEEVYSLAMLLHSLIPDIAGWNLFILGTDINPLFLAKAKRAIYKAWSFREPQAKAMQRKYFNEANDFFHLKDQIRNMVTFVQYNLMDNFPSAYHNIMAMDLILCRNVMIYFDTMTVKKLLEKFHLTLADQGWLTVGHAESWLENDLFQTHSFQNALLYQKISQPQSKPTSSPKAPTINSIIKPPEISSSSPSRYEAKSIPSKTDSLGKPAQTQPGQTHETLLEALQTLIEAKKFQAATQFIDAHFGDIPASKKALANLRLGQAHADKGDLDEARRYCQKTIDLDPLLPQAYYVLAMIAQHEGNLQDAIEQLKTAIYLDRTQPMPHFQLALLSKNQGDLTQAQISLNNTVRILKGWPPQNIVPDTEGTSVKRLLETANRILASLKAES